MKKFLRIVIDQPWMGFLRTGTGRGGEHPTYTTLAWRGECISAGIVSVSVLYRIVSCKRQLFTVEKKKKVKFQHCL